MTTGSHYHNKPSQQWRSNQSRCENHALTRVYSLRGQTKSVTVAEARRKAEDTHAKSMEMLRQHTQELQRQWRLEKESLIQEIRVRRDERAGAALLKCGVGEGRQQTSRWAGRL